MDRPRVSQLAAKGTRKREPTPQPSPPRRSIWTKVAESKTLSIRIRDLNLADFSVRPHRFA
jgi:hypothetical protein